MRGKATCTPNGRSSIRAHGGGSPRRARCTTAPTSLNGALTLHLADAPGAWQGLAGIHAKADLVLADSLLAGLALDGKASIDALGAPWAVSAELHSGGNQAHVDGAISPGHAGADALAVIDQLHLSVDAPSLQLLAPPDRAPTHGVARARGGVGRRRAGARQRRFPAS